MSSRRALRGLGLAPLTTPPDRNSQPHEPRAEEHERSGDGDQNDLRSGEDEQLLESVVHVGKIQPDREAVPRAVCGIYALGRTRGQQRVQQVGEAHVRRLVSPEVVVDRPDVLIAITRYLVTDTVE